VNKIIIALFLFLAGNTAVLHKRNRSKVPNQMKHWSVDSQKLLFFSAVLPGFGTEQRKKILEKPRSYTGLWNEYLFYVDNNKKYHQYLRCLQADWKVSDWFSSGQQWLIAGQKFYNATAIYLLWLRWHLHWIFLMLHWMPL
jgi:hypothetical protein